MRTPSTLFALACLIGLAGSQISAQEARELTIETSPQDTHLWLEEVEGEAALAWVKEQNTRSLGVLTGDERYAQFEADALDIVNSTDRIAYGTIRNGQVYNFWQDKDNVRGLWRRTSLVSYGTDAPDWETVIDFDALSASEDANWVFKGSNCYTPEGSSETRCLISLSDGGKDAVIQREFDLTTKTWVEDGFITPEAKQNASWLDIDTLLIGTDWGADGSTLTESGYASIVKRWTRGTPLESATTMVEASPTDVWLAPMVIELEDGGRIGGALRGDTFFTRTYFLFDANGQATEMPLPPRASIEDVYKGQLLVSLQQDWTPEGQSTAFESGDLISFDLAAYLETSTLPTAQLVFRPNARQSFEGVSASGATALISINDNVVGKLLKLSRSGEDWTTEAIELPGQGQTRLVFADRKADTAFINYEGFLTPDTLLAYETGTGELSALKSAPEKFDTSGLVVEQFETTSADGTKVPYFVVHREDIPLNGTTPTLLYAYGGFQISLAPSYSAITGKLWLENGGAYVLANIRGGGEFGPEWHQAGLKGNRQRIYDDFISVGEDLITRKITSPRHLGIMGGSNGGLLMGVMLNQRPDLWNAVVVQVPLLDMLRYHKLLAGASWIDEYGDPDIAEERAFLEQISPYHNFDPEAAYPIPFFLTSTKDDRVHPGHARKMAKLFEETDKPFYYYENIDGGHSAAANLTERARRSALEFMYLTQALRH